MGSENRQKSFRCNLILKSVVTLLFPPTQRPGLTAQLPKLDDIFRKD